MKMMKAIDLYAGMGGWALGLKMAGIEVVHSYEWWKPAADTHGANHRSKVTVTDIRTLDLATLPRGIDIVVGSPPCTQFSYSNRGGSGDVADGLIDLQRFLQIVRHLKPKYWALENVPRVAKVLAREIEEGGALSEFADLFEDAEIAVLDMSAFGVPQRRKRCIAGNLDFELLRNYARQTRTRTLGDVIKGLGQSRDPLFAGEKLTITDNEPEPALNEEEARFNREMKVAHPVYNGMPFPDPLNRPSRTVTATCTRVSRESLVIEDRSTGAFRRLSVRERATLQGFPAGFQFLGRSHAEKLKMIGNAIPPVFTYFVAQAFRKTKPADLILPGDIRANDLLEESAHIPTRPDRPGRTYPADRRFRFSVPNLRFKSGTRFELSNGDGGESWRVDFYFGDSKRVLSRSFDLGDLMQMLGRRKSPLEELVRATIKRFEKSVPKRGLSDLQAVWTQQKSGVHPFRILDDIGALALQAQTSDEWTAIDDEVLARFVEAALFNDDAAPRIGLQKLRSYAREIVVGIVLASVFNDLVSSRGSGRLAA